MSTSSNSSPAPPITNASTLSGDIGGGGAHVSDDGSYEGFEASSNHRFRTVGSGKDRNAQVNDQEYHRPGPKKDRKGREEESHEVYDEDYEAEDEDEEEEEWETWIDWSLCSKGTLLGED
jgi:hypothetical protein